MCDEFYSGIEDDKEENYLHCCCTWLQGPSKGIPQRAFAWNLGCINGCQLQICHWYQNGEGLIPDALERCMFTCLPALTATLAQYTHTKFHQISLPLIPFLWQNMHLAEVLQRYWGLVPHHKHLAYCPLKVWGKLPWAAIMGSCVPLGPRRQNSFVFKNTSAETTHWVSEAVSLWYSTNKSKLPVELTDPCHVIPPESQCKSQNKHGISIHHLKVF